MKRRGDNLEGTDPPTKETYILCNILQPVHPSPRPFYPSTPPSAPSVRDYRITGNYVHCLSVLCGVWCLVV